MNALRCILLLICVLVPQAESLRTLRHFSKAVGKIPLDVVKYRLQNQQKLLKKDCCAYCRIKNSPMWQAYGLDQNVLNILLFTAVLSYSSGFVMRNLSEIGKRRDLFARNGDD